MTAHSLRDSSLAHALIFVAVTWFHAQAVAQDGPDSSPSAKQIAVAVNPAGVQRFSRGGWTSLVAVGTNRTDQDTVETASVYFDDASGLQFARRFWIPAGSQRSAWLPARIPDQQRSENDRTQLSSMHLTESNGTETFNQNAVGMPISTRSLMLADEEIHTGIITELGDPSSALPRYVDTIRATVFAGRDSVIDSSLQLGLVHFVSNFLPPSPNALDELDQLVIASDRLQQDSNSIPQIRRWLHGGGRLWIMLDVTSDETVSALLGGELPYDVVDRVELNEFQLESTRTRVEAADTTSWVSERPVDLVRVITDLDGDDIPVRIDDWPAAFWVPVGSGEVLFTALEARGWITNGQLNLMGEGEASVPLYRQARRFFEERSPSRRHVEAMRPLLERQIGYRIPSRRLAASVLGLNVLVVLLGGLYWGAQRRLERMALLIPFAAALSAGVLLVAGSRNAAAVPSTVATGQLIRIDDAVSEAHVTSLSAIYSQQAESLELGSSTGTLTLPAASANEVRRLCWDDHGNSFWIGAPQPPGVVRHAASDATIPLAAPIRVRGSFDAEGFLGSVEGLSPESWEDGVIVASPNPATAVRREDASLVRGRVTDRLAPDQFTQGTLLDDDQRMRQQVLREILSPADQNPFGNRPSLLVWTEPLDLGVRFADRFQRRGTALVSIPVRIQRPSSATEFRIPASFIKTSAYAGTRGVSSIFNPRTGSWLKEMTNAADVELLFEFPIELMPLQLRRLAVEIQISAPSRTLSVKTKTDGVPKLVFEESNPTGLVQFEIDRGDALQLGRRGGLWMSVAVSESSQQAAPGSEPNSIAGSRSPEPVPNQQTAQSTWQVERLHVTAVASCPQLKESTEETP